MTSPNVSQVSRMAKLQITNDAENTKQLRHQAFAVSNEDGESVILFAKSDIEARRLAASHLDQDSIAGLFCKRAPWADRYEKANAIPAAVMLDHGWNLSCTGCDQWIADGIEDDDGNEVDLAPVGTQFAPYCTSACRDRYLAEKAMRKRGERRCWQVFKRELLRKFPGVTVEAEDSSHHHRYCGGHSKSKRSRANCFRVAFKFPGAKYVASYCYDLPYADLRGKRWLLIPNGDLDAWEEFKRSRAMTGDREDGA